MNGGTQHESLLRAQNRCASVNGLRLPAHTFCAGLVCNTLVAAVSVFLCMCPKNASSGSQIEVRVARVPLLTVVTPMPVVPHLHQSRLDYCLTPWPRITCSDLLSENVSGVAIALHARGLSQGTSMCSSMKPRVLSQMYVNATSESWSYELVNIKQHRQ